MNRQLQESYREFKPPFPVAEFVESFWELRSDTPLEEHLNRVLPDGCIDVIFNLADLPSRVDNGFPRLNSFVVGPMRKSVNVWQAGRIDLIGIRFRPGAATSFLKVSAAELTDSVVALDGLVGRLAGEAELRLAGREFAARAGLLTELLQPGVERESNGTRLVKRASALITRSHGTVPVEKLYTTLGITPRHLERLFAEHVGLSPKLACRVARFRHTVETLRRGSNAAWVDLALQCGYYDQAHLIRDFKEFAGVTPAAYHAEQMNVAFVQSEKTEAF